MRLRWSAGAAGDLEAIANYLFDKTPRHAERLIRSLFAAVAAIRNFPSRGRAGRKPGTRELVILSLPYIGIYRVSGDVVYILRILHGAQKWPD